MASQEKLETRAVIKFCKDLGKTPTETYKMLQKSRGKTSVSRALVFKWHKRFSEGREDIHDDSRSGRRSRVNDTHLTLIKDALDVDRRLTIQELSEIADLSVGTVHTILKRDLKMRKVHARWVPRLLKDTEKERRVADSKAFLKRYRKQGNNFLDYIITTDETWLYLHDPETKTQSAVWKRSGSAPPEKARVSRSAGKQMYIMFCDRRGMLLCHPIPNGSTVNADYYSKVLRRDLLRALRKKRPEIDLDKFRFHQDNAPAHTAASTLLDISLLGFEIIKHPPYSPDLAPFDFAIFPTIKSHLKGNRYGSFKELQDATNAVIKMYPQEWYENIFDQWIYRHQRCIECNGRYFEKL